MSVRKLTVLNEWEVDDEGTNVPKIFNDYLHKDWNYKQKNYRINKSFKGYA